MPDHPKNHQGYIQEHIFIAEIALGRFMPRGVIVHHHDKDRSNNANDNLVICEDTNYHHILHERMRIIEYGGDPNNDLVCGKCRRCLPKSMFFVDKSRSRGFTYRCRNCQNIRRSHNNERKKMRNVQC